MYMALPDNLPIICFATDRGYELTRMSLISDAAGDAAKDLSLQAENSVSTPSNFRFVPKELAIKSRKLIESYHAIHGYARLPDMLWHSDARDDVECNRELTRVFRIASKARCAKRANDSLVLVATVIVSLEVLARDFAGWGRRFPSAKREAEAMLGDLGLKQRNWFMDQYLYPSLGIHRHLVSSLAPSAADHAAIRN